MPLPAGRFSFLQPHWAFALAPVGACAYIAGSALPFRWDIPLVVLALSGGSATILSRRNGAVESSPLFWAVVVFLIVTAASVSLSRDLSRSLTLSAPLVPAVLLFFVIADHFQGTRQIRALYLTFSVVGLGLSAAVLFLAWTKNWSVPYGWEGWISEVRSPILIVPNDIAFLAAVAPLSLALLWCDRRKIVRVVCALSIVASLLAVLVMRSRGALVTMIGALVLAALFLRPRAAVPLGLGILSASLLADGLLGFPLTSKFGLIWDAGSGRLWDARFPIWSAAWSMFRDAPIWGQGPHTFSYTSPDSIHVPWPHNLYLEMLAEQGILGLLGLGFLLASGFSAALTVQRAGQAETRTLGVGVLTALLAFCFAALFELSFLREWVVILLFTLLGVITQLYSIQRRLEVKT